MGVKSLPYLELEGRNVSPAADEFEVALQV
jgi:hypothetical protein